MRARVMLTAAALAALTLTAAGCGNNRSATQADAGTARALDRIEEICDDWAAAVSDREFPVDDFDPRHPAVADLPAVGDYFEPAVRAERRTLTALRSLTLPPEIGQDVQRYMTALAGLLDLVTEQVAAAHAADPERFAATIGQADARLDAVTRAADDLGIDSCRGDAS